MSRYHTSCFSFNLARLLIFGAVMFLVSSGFVAEPAHAQGRIIRVSNIAAGSNFESQIEVRILLDSQGDEASTSFSLNFNPAILTNPRVARGRDVPEAAEFAINTSSLAQGRIGIVINSSNTYIAGTRTIATVIFTIPIGSQIGIYPLTFGNVPTPRSVLSSTAEPLAATYETGAVAIGTADGVAVSGRVVTPDGNGLLNALVIVTDSQGNRRFATTGSGGYFIISYVRLGETNTYSVISKRYRFSPRSVQIFGLLPDLVFVGLE